MVGTLTRWHQLRHLLNIKFGPGAAVMPPNVTRIHMEFSRKADGGHMGSRKFWKEILPRLKYHNPAIPMLVSRRVATEGPAILTIYLRTAPSPVTPTNETPSAPTHSAPVIASGVSVAGTPAPPPAADEQAVTIDMKNLHSDTILSKFLATTRAVAISPTEAEEKEIEEDRLMRGKAELDRGRVRAKVEEDRRERDMLERARKDLSGV